MKLLFPYIIIEEFADVTEILSHSNSTVCANLSDRLLSVTNCTNNLFNILANKFVAIIGVPQQARSLVMAMAAGVDLIAARCTNLASPPIMLAPIAHPPKIKTFIVCRAFHFWI